MQSRPAQPAISPDLIGDTQGIREQWVGTLGFRLLGIYFEDFLKGKVLVSQSYHNHSQIIYVFEPGGSKSTCRAAGWLGSRSNEATEGQPHRTAQEEPNKGWWGTAAKRQSGACFSCENPAASVSSFSSESHLFTLFLVQERDIEEYQQLQQTVTARVERAKAADLALKEEILQSVKSARNMQRQVAKKSMAELGHSSNAYMKRIQNRMATSC